MDITEQFQSNLKYGSMIVVLYDRTGSTSNQKMASEDFPYNFERKELHKLLDKIIDKLES